MNTRRISFVTIGVVIDTFQAALTVWLIAWGGTAVGAAAGCAIGEKIAGQTGCAVGATVFGILGTFLNFTPFGPALGATIAYILCFCISLGAGTLLVTLIAFSAKGHFWNTCLWRTLGVFGAELFPFLNIGIPGWAAYAWYCTAKIEKAEAKTNKTSKDTLRPATPNFSDIRPVRKVVAVLVLMFLCTGASVQAQTMPPPLQYVVYPEAPGPAETVRIEVQGVGSFLGSAEIVWRKDGVKVAEGIGERSYSFTTGKLGQKTTIQVSIDSSQGVFANTFTFNPSLINLVWEADTSVPPRYKGKALYSPGSAYKVVALPSVIINNARISASALSYQWTRAGDAISDQSGLGRTTVSLIGDQLQSSEDIAVEVYYGTALVGKGSVSILASAPQIILYERDPLRGVQYDTALPAGISLASKEITIQAEPYFFSNKAKNSGLIPYAWTLDGEETVGPDSARGILTLRQTGAGAGGALIGISMQNNNPDQFVQNANTMLQLVFGADTGNSLLNFFGL